MNKDIVLDYLNRYNKNKSATNMAIIISTYCTIMGKDLDSITKFISILNGTPFMQLYAEYSAKELVTKFNIYSLCNRDKNGLSVIYYF